MYEHEDEGDENNEDEHVISKTVAYDHNRMYDKQLIIIFFFYVVFHHSFEPDLYFGITLWMLRTLFEQEIFGIYRNAFNAFV